MVEGFRNVSHGREIVFSTAASELFHASQLESVQRFQKLCALRICKGGEGEEYAVKV